jgi:hypothetical protein
MRIKRDGTRGPKEEKLTSENATIREYQRRTANPKAGVKAFLASLVKAEADGLIAYQPSENRKGSVTGYYPVESWNPNPDTRGPADFQDTLT